MTAVTLPAYGTPTRAARASCHSPRNLMILQCRTCTPRPSQPVPPPAADAVHHSFTLFQARTENQRWGTGYHMLRGFMIPLTRTWSRRSETALTLIIFQSQRRVREPETKYRSPPASLTPLFRTEKQESGPRKPNQAADASPRSTTLFQAWA